MRIFLIILTIIFFVLLTILTQVGGITLLLFIWTTYLLRKRWKWLYKPWPIILGFPIVYLIVTFAIMPLMAPLTGRTALPCFRGNLKPLTIGTCICNRQYVKVGLKAVALDAAHEMATAYPTSNLYYLDANFPFIDGFPLLPHLSHNDGGKLDLAFYYKDTTGIPIEGKPSIIGYGVFEGPKPDEPNKARECADQGHWQYGFMERIVPQDKAKTMHLDEMRTKALLVILGKDIRVKKIFLEPHLKERMGLTGYAKIRFQGCHSVRHDDHVHIQL
ncbi:hypothetical protein BH09BAC1_BH09BAC1_24880 [soil metagenome]